MHLGLYSDHQTSATRPIQKNQVRFCAAPSAILSLGQLLTTAKASVPPTFRRALHVPPHCKRSIGSPIASLRLLLQFAFPDSLGWMANAILVRTRLQEAGVVAPSGLLRCWLRPKSSTALAKRKHPKAQPRSQRSVASRGKSASDAHHLPPTPTGAARTLAS